MPVASSGFRLGLPARSGEVGAQASHCNRALGHGAGLEAEHHAREGVEDDLPVRVGPRAAHEVAVELVDLRPHIQDHLVVRLAQANVVECDRQPRLAQLRERLDPLEPAAPLGLAPVPNPSFEEADGTTPVGWRTQRFSGQADMLLPDEGWVPVEAPADSTGGAVPAAL